MPTSAQIHVIIAILDMQHHQQSESVNAPATLIGLGSLQTFCQPLGVNLLSNNPVRED
jgi:hypothetical protein